MIVITFGTFDLYHVGHKRILERASQYGDLIVGISSDELNFSKKQKYPVYNFEERKEILDSVRYIKKTFKEESLEKKRQYILDHKAHYLVMGSDWQGKFDDLKDICEVIYLPRTEDVSTTETISKIQCVNACKDSE